MIDDVTKKRFDNLDAKIEAVETDLRGRLTTVAAGLESVIAQGLAATEGRILDRLGSNHAEQMRKFQSVMDQAEDRRLSKLEAEVESLRAMLVSLMGATKQ